MQLLAAGPAGEHEVEQPDAEAGDDGSFPVDHGEALRKPHRHHLQGDGRNEHLEDEENEETDAQSADADQCSQQTEDKADEGEEEAGDDAFRPEAAVNGNAGDDGREDVGEENGHEGDAEEEFHDLLSK